MVPSGSIDIDPNGDVVLVCGQSRIRVSSAIMSMSSSVFKCMLGPYFKEGHSLASAAGSSIELELPDDDEEALATVCYVVHHKNKCVGKMFSTDQIWNIAVVTDTYDWCEALHLGAQCWIDLHLRDLHTTSHSKLCRLFGAAYLFKHAALFRQLGMKLVLEGSTKSAFKCDDCHAILGKVLNALRDGMTRIHDAAGDVIEERVREHTTRRQTLSVGQACEPNCAFPEACAGILLVQLEAKQLWPAILRREQPVEEMLLEMDAFTTKWPKNIPVCNSGMCVGLRDVEAKGFEKEESVLRDSIKVLCLACVEEGKPDLKQGCEHSRGGGGA